MIALPTPDGKVLVIETPEEWERGIDRRAALAERIPAERDEPDGRFDGDHDA